MRLDFADLVWRILDLVEMGGNLTSKFEPGTLLRTK
jgi:hypothetical protein